MSWIVRSALLFAGLNLKWELLQFQLHALWRIATAGKTSLAFLHCTAGHQRRKRPRSGHGAAPHC